MHIRIHTLWRVPVFCSFASLICAQLTVLLGQFFFIVKTVDDSGAVTASIDPVRSAIFHVTLFLVVLLLGGLWAFRSMTRAEIAVSAAILSALYLALTLAQLYIPDFPVNMAIISFQQWISTVSSLLLKVIDNFTIAVLLADLTPFLFIPFGKKRLN